jgi:hypothetical protein
MKFYRIFTTIFILIISHFVLLAAGGGDSFGGSFAGSMLGTTLGNVATSRRESSPPPRTDHYLLRDIERLSSQIRSLEAKIQSEKDYTERMRLDFREVIDGINRDIRRLKENAERDKRLREDLDKAREETRKLRMEMREKISELREPQETER